MDKNCLHLVLGRATFMIRQLRLEEVKKIFMRYEHYLSMFDTLSGAGFESCYQ